MISREKEQLLDSVEFLQQEIKNTDSNLLGKEKELQKIKLEKELQVIDLICYFAKLSYHIFVKIRNF